MFLDRKQPIAKSFRGDLPHWHQDEVMQFVTFRLADSLPQSVLTALQERDSEFVEKHPGEWTPEVLAEYRSLMSRSEENYLHQGYGCSVFRHPQFRKIFIDSLMRGDSLSYTVFAYVVMPNHVHILLQPYEDVRVNDIIGRIKQFTSNRINKELGKTGTLWQREMFDRLVRSEDEFLRYVEYIRENPKNLKEGEFEVYVKPGAEASQPPSFAG